MGHGCFCYALMRSIPVARPAVPPVHMERLLAEAALRGNARVHHGRHLPVLYSHGPEPLSEGARLKISV